MTIEEFMAGMAKLAFGLDVDAPGEREASLYFETLQPLSVEEWSACVLTTIRTWRPRESKFPPVAVLWDNSGATAVEEARTRAEAVERYERVQRLDPRDWSYRTVRERLGAAVALAFMAAGGPYAFRWCSESDEPFRRRSFVAAFLAAVKDPARAELPLPTLDERRQLGSGQ